MSDEGEKSGIDERRLAQMKYKILELERGNLNTGEKTNDRMVELIKKTIIDIADKTY